MRRCTAVVREFGADFDRSVTLPRYDSAGPVTRAHVVVHRLASVRPQLHTVHRGAAGTTGPAQCRLKHDGPLRHAVRAWFNVLTCCGPWLEASRGHFVTAHAALHVDAR